MAPIVFKFNGMNTVVDPEDEGFFNPRSPLYGQCADICNCDVSDTGRVTRRTGSVRVASGAFSNCWSNGVYVYGAVGNRLVYFNLSSGIPAVVLFSGVPALTGPVEFVQVNEVVVFSDQTTLGIITGTTAEIVDKPIINLV